MAKITIGIVNYNRSKMLSPCPERSGDEFLYLLPQCIQSLNNSMDAYNNKKTDSFHLFLVDFESTDWPLKDWITCCWHHECTIITAEKPFSIGRGRNIIINNFVGDVLILLDADMFCPANFIQTMVETVGRGCVVFPQDYRYTNPEQTKSTVSVGYGNMAISKAAITKLMELTKGKPYPENQTWGGEDVAVAHLIEKHNVAPICREIIEGFYHQWHPKTSDYYKKIQ